MNMTKGENVQVLLKRICSFIINQVTSIRIAVVMLVVTAVMGFIFEYAGHVFASRVLPVSQFEILVHRKQKKAMECLLDMIKDGQVRNGRRLEVYEKRAKENGMECFVFDDDLIYWTGNSINIDSLKSLPLDSEFYYLSANYHCIGVSVTSGHHHYVSLIKVRTKFYPVEQNRDSYTEGFEMPASVEITNDIDYDSYPIKGISGTELFRLKQTPVSIRNIVLDKITSGCWYSFVAILMYLILLVQYKQRNGEISKGKYRIASTLLILIPIVSVLLKLPMFFYSSSVFSKGQFSSSMSLGDSLIYMIAISLFYFFVLREWANEQVGNLSLKTRHIIGFISILLLSVLAYFSCYEYVRGSGVSLLVPYVQDLKIDAIIVVVITTVWFIVFTCILYQIFEICEICVNLTKTSIIVFVLTIIVLIFSLSLVSEIWLTYLISTLLLLVYLTIHQSYKLIPQMMHWVVVSFYVIYTSISLCINFSTEYSEERMMKFSAKIADSGHLTKDKSLERIVSSMANMVNSDLVIKNMLRDSNDCTDDIVKHIRENYYQNYFDRYDIDVRVNNILDPILVRYTNNEMRKLDIGFVKNNYERVKNIDFFYNSTDDLSLCYIGFIDNGYKRLSVIFYPSVSYSRIHGPSVFDKYKSETGDIAGLSIAQYTKGKLQVHFGRCRYAPTTSALNFNQNRTYLYVKGDYKHYVTKYSDTGYIVVSVPIGKIDMFMILFSTLLGVFLLTVSLWLVVKQLISRGLLDSITNRMLMLTFLSMIFSFGTMIWFSLKYFFKQYESERLLTQVSQISSVQTALQEFVGFQSDIKKIKEEDMDNMLREYCDILSSDIIVYDKVGRQISTNNPELKIKGYNIKRSKSTHLMSPEARFSDNERISTQEMILDRSYRTIYSHLYNTNNVKIGYVQVLSPMLYATDQSQVFNFLAIVINGFLVVVIVSLLSLWVISRMFAKPLEDISSKLTNLTLLGDNPKVYYKYPKDEVGLLVTRYNQMVDELKASASQLAKSERETAWRDMARCIAHEIKNPLTPMKLSVQMSQRKLETDPEGFSEYFENTCEMLIEQIENLSRIASEFSDFAKVTQGDHIRIDIISLLKRAIDLYKHNPEGVLVQSDISYEEKVYVIGDDKQFSQVFNNLLRNAIQSIPEDQPGFVNVFITKDDKKVIIEVRDNGRGIPENIRGRIFEPNFTTKNSGMGLGLAITKSIVTAAKGEIWFETETNKGTSFFISYPITD